MNPNKTEKEILAKRAIFRASSGLHFLDQCLIHIHRGATDPAFSRSCYILFSFNFELILKSYLLLTSKQTEKSELIKEIKSHNLDKLSKKLSKDELGNIGIKNIRTKKDSGFKEYLIAMTTGNNIVIQDLIDVRYDFEKGNLRNIDKNESTRMNNEVDILLEMTKKVMKMLEYQND
ncbi:MAG: hypothetical protein Q8Q95_04205 [bacterium]|nr:hypothetical protein [bacterium]